MATGRRQIQRGINNPNWAFAPLMPGMIALKQIADPFTEQMQQVANGLSDLFDAKAPTLSFIAYTDDQLKTNLQQSSRDNQPDNLNEQVIIINEAIASFDRVILELLTDLHVRDNSLISLTYEYRGVANYNIAQRYLHMSYQQSNLQQKILDSEYAIIFFEKAAEDFSESASRLEKEKKAQLFFYQAMTYYAIADTYRFLLPPTEQNANALVLARIKADDALSSANNFVDPSTSADFYYTLGSWYPKDLDHILDIINCYYKALEKNPEHSKTRAALLNIREQPDFSAKAILSDMMKSNTVEMQLTWLLLFLDVTTSLGKYFWYEAINSWDSSSLKYDVLNSLIAKYRSIDSNSESKLKSKFDILTCCQGIYNVTHQESATQTKTNKHKKDLQEMFMRLFLDEKEDIFNAISKSLLIDILLKISLLKDCINPKTLLGKRFWHKDSWSIYTPSLTRGTLKLVIEELGKLEPHINHTYLIIQQLCRASKENQADSSELSALYSFPKSTILLAIQALDDKQEKAGWITDICTEGNRSQLNSRFWYQESFALLIPNLTHGTLKKANDYLQTLRSEVALSAISAASDIDLKSSGATSSKVGIFGSLFGTVPSQDEDLHNSTSYSSSDAETDDFLLIEDSDTQEPSYIFEPRTGNEVKFYSDAYDDEESTSGAFHDILSSIDKAKNSVLITGWTLSPYECFRYYGEHISLPALFARKAMAGVYICLLIWDNIAPDFIQDTRDFNKRVEEEIRKLASNEYNKNITGPSADVIATEILSKVKIKFSKTPIGYSDHAKMVIVDSETLYMGGLDLTVNRSNIKTWHDCHCRIIGPSVLDAIKLFRNRFYAQSSPFGVDKKTEDILNDVINRAHANNQLLLTATAENELSSDMPAKKPIMQLLTSIRKQYYDPENHEKRRWLKEKYTNELLNSQVNAINNAKNFIYMETQFFSGPRFHRKNKSVIEGHNKVIIALANKIKEKIRAGEEFHFYCQLPFRPEGNHDDILVNTILRKQWKTMEWFIQSIQAEIDEYNSNPLNEDKKVISEYVTFTNLGFYDPNKSIENGYEMKYTHSKLMIIDDDVAFIGSNNCNERSHKGSRDHEICMRMEHYPEIKAYRQQLMEQHFGTECMSNIQDANPGSSQFSSVVQDQLAKNLATLKNAEISTSVMSTFWGNMDLETIRLTGRPLHVPEQTTRLVAAFQAVSKFAKKFTI